MMTVQIKEDQVSKRRTQSGGGGFFLYSHIFRNLPKRGDNWLWVECMWLYSSCELDGETEFSLLFHFEKLKLQYYTLLFLLPWQEATERRKGLFWPIVCGAIFHYGQESMVAGIGGQLVTLHLQSRNSEWTGSVMDYKTSRPSPSDLPLVWLYLLMVPQPSQAVPLSGDKWVNTWAERGRVHFTFKLEEMVLCG